MTSYFRQAARGGRLSTALGPDVLVLVRLDGSERMNGSFEFRVEALAAAGDLPFDSILGTHASVEIETIEHGPRHFDGIVSEISYRGIGDNGHRYDLRLQPWTALAALRRNQRIFHNRTVVQILEEVFNDWAHMGQPAWKLRLTATYPVLEYTVQYRESDAAFAFRLMERFGISWHFAHEAGNHCMVLTDSIGEHDAAPGGQRELRPQATRHQGQGEYLHDWAPEARITTGTIRLTDYNFKTPLAAMETDLAGDAAHAEGRVESFDYPGDYPDQGLGRTMVQRRLDQERGGAARFSAAGPCSTLAAGLTVSLTGAEAGAMRGKRFLCLEVRHSYSANSYGTGRAPREEPPYSGSYLLMPADAPLAPARVTAEPRVQGPQTAVVVGEGEIDCDEYGRILVRFHWDLKGAHSMRCRVSQNWAGGGWGGMVIPRIGMEVVVEFLEGDPDKPLVTGCVFNGRNKVPYDLPANKTRSTFKTDTHQGEGFNELRFEDKAGAEEIYIHAQKDRNEKTLNNHSERIDNNWVQSVGHNKSIEVRNNHVEAIGGNMSLTVGPSGVGQVVASALNGLAGGIGAVANALGLRGALNPGEGNMSVIVEKNKAEMVGITSSVTVGLAHLLTAGKTIEMTSGEAMGISVGKRATETVGKTKTITVGDELTIIVGAARITMKKNGDIAIDGANIMVKGTKNIEVKASGNTTVKGSKIDMN